MELVRPAGERAKLDTGRGAIGGLGKTLGAERECLVSAEREPARIATGHGGRFLARQEGRDFAGPLRWRVFFQDALVEIGRGDLDRNSRVLEQRQPRFAARSDEERRAGEPKRHA
jgi:hypothetical protein